MPVFCKFIENGKKCGKGTKLNKRGLTKALYCKAHAVETFGKDHIANVKSPKCSFDGCDMQPVFGPPGSKKGLTCNSHKA